MACSHEFALFEQLLFVISSIKYYNLIPYHLLLLLKYSSNYRPPLLLEQWRGNNIHIYRLSQVYAAATAWGSQTTFAENNTIYNDALKPEITTALEFGLEARLWNRINAEITYYDKLSNNQILKIGVPQSSGYLNKFVNAGEISNKGIELQLSATPIKTESGFRWDVGVNFAKNVSKVNALDGLDTPVRDFQFLDVQGRVHFVTSVCAPPR